MSALGEAAKLPAFVRRDLRIAASYRFGAAVGIVGLGGEVVALSFFGRLVDRSRLPVYGTTHASYLEFVGIGIAVNVVVLLLVHQLAKAIRNEQLIGTLESVLATPTRLGTLQIGSAMFVLVNVPLRMAVFVGLISVLFGLHLQAAGIAPALVMLLAFLPFVWGLGLIGGSIVLTLRSGMGAIGAGTGLLGLGSGAFFPVGVMPVWVRTLSAWNPMALAIDGIRDALIGGAGFDALGPAILKLAVLAVTTVVLGAVAFRCVVRRERRLGTIGLY